MKVFHYLPKNIGSFAIFSILLTACVNHISEENEAIIADGNIPLKFVTDIHELINTRIVGNSFEEGEGVGLFALAGSLDAFYCYQYESSRGKHIAGVEVGYSFWESSDC